MDLQDVRSVVGETAWTHARELVRAAYPDPKCNFGDGLIARAICAMSPEVREAIGAGALAVDVAEGILRLAYADPGRPRAPEVSYLLATAVHARHDRGVHRFVAQLPMARVLLDREGSHGRDLDTDFGVVFAGDHLVSTAAAIARKYHDVFDFEVGDVYLTTPARYLGARFAAVATYEVFDQNRMLRAWLLEAGMATGESLVLFCSPHGNPIARRSWYVPTPFASMTHWYRGDAEFSYQGPTKLHVAVCTLDELEQRKPHVTVDVVYAPSPGATAVMPSKLTVQAGLRVATIAVARGTDNPLFHLLAPFGRALAWEKEPTTT